MLPFNEIKNDIKNDYKYYEYYSGPWYKYDINITLENNFVVVLVQWDYIETACIYEHFTFLKIYKNDFLNYKYSDFITLIEKNIFYNVYTN